MRDGKLRRKIELCIMTVSVFLFFAGCRQEKDGY